MIVADQNLWQKGKWNFCQVNRAGFKVQSQKTWIIYCPFLVLTRREIWSSVWHVEKLENSVIDGGAESYSCCTREAVLSQQHYAVPLFEKSRIYVVTRWRGVNNPENSILRSPGCCICPAGKSLMKHDGPKHQMLFMVSSALNIIHWRKPRR
jgi:hypothetical protein